MIERTGAHSDIRGKELMHRGVDKLLYGIALTVSNEIQHGLKGGLIGGVIGIPMGIIDRDVMAGVKDYAIAGAGIGALWAWLTSSAEFNNHAAQERMKPVQWYDWLGAVVISSKISRNERPFGTVSFTESMLWGQFFNPISTSAMKDIAHGGLQVMFG